MRITTPKLKYVAAILSSYKCFKMKMHNMVPFLISRHNYTDKEVSLVLHLRRPQDQSGLSQFAYALVKTNRNSFFSLRDSMSEQK